MMSLPMSSIRRSWLLVGTLLKTGGSCVPIWRPWIVLRQEVAQREHNRLPREAPMPGLEML